METKIGEINESSGSLAGVKEASGVKYTMVEEDATTVDDKPKKTRRNLGAIEARVGGMESKLDEVSESIVNLTRVLTLQGKPIHPNEEHLVTFGHTDQGVSETNAKAPPGPSVTVTTAAEDQPVIAYSEQPWTATDPMKAVVDKVREPGKAYRLLSDTVVSKKGMRDWVYTRDKEGNAVKCGELQLAEMPQHRADARNAYFAQETADRKQEAKDNVVENQDRLVREAANEGTNVSGYGPLHTGETVHGKPITGIHSVRGNLGELSQ